MRKMRGKRVSRRILAIVLSLILSVGTFYGDYVMTRAENVQEQTESSVAETPATETPATPAAETSAAPAAETTSEQPAATTEPVAEVTEAADNNVSASGETESQSEEGTEASSEAGTTESTEAVVIDGTEESKEEGTTSETEAIVTETSETVGTEVVSQNDAAQGTSDGNTTEAVSDNDVEEEVSSNDVTEEVSANDVAEDVSDNDISGNDISENDVSDNDIEEVAYDLEFSQSVEIDGILISLYAAPEVLPNDARLVVNRVPYTLAKNAEEAIDKATGDNVEVVESYTYDITIQSESLGEVQPKNGTVRLTFKEVVTKAEATSDTELSVYHVNDNGNQVSSVEQVGASAQASTDISVDTSHFSVYTITFTHNVGGTITAYLVDKNKKSVGDAADVELELWKTYTDLSKIAPAVSGYKFVGAYYGYISDWYKITRIDVGGTDETRTLTYWNGNYKQRLSRASGFIYFAYEKVEDHTLTILDADDTDGEPLYTNQHESNTSLEDVTLPTMDTDKHRVLQYVIGDNGEYYYCNVDANRENVTFSLSDIQMPNRDLTLYACYQSVPDHLDLRFEGEVYKEYIKANTSYSSAEWIQDGGYWYQTRYKKFVQVFAIINGEEIRMEELGEAITDGDKEYRLPERDTLSLDSTIRFKIQVVETEQYYDWSKGDWTDYGSLTLGDAFVTDTFGIDKNFEAFTWCYKQHYGIRLSNGSHQYDFGMDYAFSKKEDIHPTTYTITWMSQDGNTELGKTEGLAENAAPSYPDNFTEPVSYTNKGYKYTFEGWSSNSGSSEGEELNELPAVTGNVTYYAAFSEKQDLTQTKDVSYKINYFEETTNNEYPETPTRSSGEKTKTVWVNATAASFAEGDINTTAPTGFEVDSEQTGTIPTEFTIPADGKPYVFNVYFKRKIYEVTYSYDGKTPDGIKAATENNTTAKYGATVTVAGNPIENSDTCGYTFDGWKYNDSVITEITEISSDVALVGSFTPKQITCVEKHVTYVNNQEVILQDENQQAASYSSTKDFGTTFEATAKTFTGYELKDASAASQSLTVGQNGLGLESNTITFVYKPKSYTVKYEIVSSPEGTEGSRAVSQKKALELLNGNYSIPGEFSAEYDSDVKDQIAATPSLTSYEFYGWQMEVNNEWTTVGENGFKMPAHEVTLRGYFIKKAPVSYRVEHYFMDKDGRYSGRPSVVDETNTATPGETVDLVALGLIKTETGFTHDVDNTAKVESGTIPTNGTKLVLKVYYKRNKYTVTYKYNHAEGQPVAGTSTPNPAENRLPIATEYYYGQTVEVIKPATAAGYKFNGWTINQIVEDAEPTLIERIKEYSGWFSWETNKFLMPAGNVEISGSFEADYTAYTVEHYFQNTSQNGYDRDRSLDQTYGNKKADEEAAYSFYENIPGFTPALKEDNTNKVDFYSRKTAWNIWGWSYTYDNPVETTTVLPDGSLVIKLYYDRITPAINYVAVLNDGSEPVEENFDAKNTYTSYVYGVDIGSLNDATYTDAKFLGWYYNKACTQKVNEPVTWWDIKQAISTTETADVTFYALFGVKANVEFYLTTPATVEAWRSMGDALKDDAPKPWWINWWDDPNCQYRFTEAETGVGNYSGRDSKYFVGGVVTGTATIPFNTSVKWENKATFNESRFNAYKVGSKINSNTSVEDLITVSAPDTVDKIEVFEEGGKNYLRTEYNGVIYEAAYDSINWYVLKKQSNGNWHVDGAPYWKKVGTLNDFNVTGTEVIYDAQNHSVTVSGAKGATLTYAYDGMTEDADSTENPKFVDAGNYTVSVTASYGQFESTKSAAVVINKREVIIQTLSAHKTFDGTPLIANDEVKVNAIAGEEDVREVIVKNLGTTPGIYNNDIFPGEGEGIEVVVNGSVVSGTAANTFTVKVANLKDNYVLKGIDGDLRIIPRKGDEVDQTIEINVNGVTATYTYDGNAHAASGYTIPDIENFEVSELVIEYNYNYDAEKAYVLKDMDPVIIDTTPVEEKDPTDESSVIDHGEEASAVKAFNTFLAKAFGTMTVHAVDTTGYEIPEDAVTFGITNTEGVTTVYAVQGVSAYVSAVNVGTYEQVVEVTDDTTVKIAQQGVAAEKWVDVTKEFKFNTNNGKLIINAVPSNPTTTTTTTASTGGQVLGVEREVVTIEDEEVPEVLGADRPQTGDDANVIVWVVLMATVAMIFGYVLIRRKKEEDAE